MSLPTSSIVVSVNSPTIKQIAQNKLYKPNSTEKIVDNKLGLRWAKLSYQLGFGWLKFAGLYGLIQNTSCELVMSKY